MDHTSRPTFNTAGLFTPGRLGPYTLPHRLLMAPMTRNRARRDGVPSQSAVIYYAQRASAAMIVTETTTVSEQAVGYPLIPGIHTADQVAGWKPVVDAVHRFGCRFFLQLFHAGRISHPSLQPGQALPVAPSPIAPNGQTPTYQGPAPFVPPRGLALKEIPNIVEQFRVAAHNALLAGFDGVEIHAANGYLLDQFLRTSEQMPGRADFVSFGKLFLANPDLPLRFARRAPLNVPDRASFYGGDDRGYIDYPFLEEPAPALRRLVLAAGGRVEHLAFMGDRSTSPSCC